MCDSARCPQAIHYPCHRPVWAEYGERTETFIGQLGTTRRTERTRLQADHDRALRVVAEIDTASTIAHEESAESLARLAAQHEEIVQAPSSHCWDKASQPPARSVGHGDRGLQLIRQDSRTVRSHTRLSAVVAGTLADRMY